MRLCILTREYPPVTSYTGGIGTVMAALAPALARLGHEVHVITVTTGATHTKLLAGVHVSVLHRPNPERLWFLEDAGWTIAVNRRLRALGHFDAIFAPEWGGDAALYARRKGCGPLVTNLTTSLEQALTISPGWERSARQRLRHRVQCRLERAQAARSDALIASSHAILEWARRLWDIAHVPSVVLPNGADVAHIRATSKGMLPEDFPVGRGPVVAFSGRLESRKGVHVLVPAMHRVWEAIPDAQLVLMGRDGDWRGGRMSDHLRELSGAGEDRLHLLGLQAPERLFPGLCAADVVALPSLWENFALAAVETIILGRPLVATSGSGYDDFVTDGVDGLLVPPGDAEALSDALLRLLGNPALRARLGGAAAVAGEQLDIDAVAVRYADHFASLSRG